MVSLAPKPYFFMRTKLVAGNWKMNTTPEEGQKLASEVVNMVKDELNSNVQVVLAPPFTHLYQVARLVGDAKNISLAAQNVSEHEKGAYTGEVSVAMLKNLGVKWVIIGHSERREYFKESGQQLAKKLDAVLAGGLQPIFCCGEPLEIRESDQHQGYVQRQLEESLFHLSEEQMRKVVIAYEPIWAIGTGKTASDEQAQDMHAHIRQQLAGKWGEALAQEIRILYGGSVNAGNAKALFAKPDVDGGLVGGASLKSRDFTDIVKAG
jgi:triosephosphate isomerase (TIM)